MGPAPQNSQYLSVAYLICQTSKTWMKERIRELLPAYEQEILEIRPSQRGAKDRYLWLLTKSGEYTAKSGYHAASQTEAVTASSPPLVDFAWTKEIWNINTSPKIIFFLWKAMKQALPTGGKPETSRNCIYSCMHTFYARSIWEQVPFKHPIEPSRILTLRKGIESSKLLINFPPIGRGRGPLFPWIMWTIWTCRNKRIFEQKQIGPSDAISQAVSQAREWLAAQISLRQPTHPRIPYPIDEIEVDTIRVFTDAA
ncbi:putative reverse transcriptase zinc-binding domain-containing protein [Arabidopsis thaliana]